MLLVRYVNHTDRESAVS